MNEQPQKFGLRPEEQGGNGGPKRNKPELHVYDVAEENLLLDTRKNEASYIESDHQKEISDSSSQADKEKFIEQQRRIALIENDLRDATELLARNDISEEDKEKLMNLLADAAKKTSEIRAEIARLKEAYPSAAEYVRGFLYGRDGEESRVGEDTDGKLNIKWYKYTKDLQGDDNLDIEKIVRADARAKVSYAEGSPVRLQFPKIDDLKKSFEPILTKAIEKKLAELSEGNQPPTEKEIRSKVESACVDEMSQILYFLDQTYSSNGVVVESTSKRPDKRGYILAALLRRDQKTEDVKAKKLGFSKTGYVDETVVTEDDLADPDLIADIVSLTGKTEEELRTQLADILPPISKEVASSLEKFVDEGGEVVRLVSGDAIVAKLTAEKGEYGKLTAFSEIKAKIKEISEIDSLEKKIKLQSQLQEIEGKISGFKKVEPVKNVFGMVKNRDEVSESEKALAALENQRDNIEKEINELASVDSKKYGMDSDAGRKAAKDRIQRGIEKEIVRLFELQYKFDLPDLVAPFDRQSKPSIDVSLRPINIKLEPLDTLVARIEGELKKQANDISDKILTETKVAIERFTKDFDKTKAVLERSDLAEIKQPDMTAAILAYIQGRISDKSIDEAYIYGDTKKTFYLAGQESRRKQHESPIYAIPNNLKDRVSAFSVLS